MLRVGLYRSQTFSVLGYLTAVGGPLVEAAGLPLYNTRVFKQLDAPLRYTLLWPLGGAVAGGIGGAATWAFTGAPDDVGWGAAVGGATGAALGLLAGAVDGLIPTWQGGGSLAQSLALSVAPVRIDRAADPISRPVASYGWVPALSAQF